ncbi:MAG: LicD family protein [Lachnospiraceae bacterium]|nr:LicD family protein [Lachnospiraceae bacterium]
MNQLQKEILEELIAFDAVARDAGVPYTLHGGTLLGAAREHGFIAWDNDADVAIFSKDYPKFKKAFEEAGSRYKIIDDFTAGSYAIVDKEQGGEASADIFIYDYISENKLAQKIKILGVIFLQAMLKTKETIKLTEDNNHGKGKTFLYKCAYGFGKLFSRKTKEKWYHRFCSKAFVGQKNRIFLSNDSAKYLNACVPVKYMQAFDEIEFEGHQFFVTSCYNELLTDKYGADYMTPKQNDEISKRHDRFRDMLSEEANKE